MAGIEISNFQSSSRLSLLIRDFQELLIETERCFHIPAKRRGGGGGAAVGVNNLVKCNKAIWASCKHNSTNLLQMSSK